MLQSIFAGILKQNFKMAANTAMFMLARCIENNRRRMGIMHAALNYALEKRRMLVTLSGAVSLLVSSENKCIANRSCRRLPRNTGWWDQIWTTYSDTRFKKTFRVSKFTFNYILENIKDEITHDMINEQPVSAECRLGICLYRLGRGDYYYTISEMSGLGISTVCEIVSEVSRAIINKLRPVQTKPTYRSNIIQHCWMQHVGLV